MDDPFPVRSVMTAPFTADPAALQPKRLRSQPHHAVDGSMYGWQVGCGLAAFAGAPHQLMVVRLSDGVAWFIDDSAETHFDGVIGLTCDDVFVRAIVESQINVVRIGLADLGPGVPPD